mmetsp:Transcript_26143/g.82731  ORF Transcript_26143/g.82731 Transcript_26143/m.82731 type:complete len:311 (+) Transcript_26143:168-1100(+)
MTGRLQSRRLSEVDEATALLPDDLDELLWSALLCRQQVARQVRARQAQLLLDLDQLLEACKPLVLLLAHLRLVCRALQLQRVLARGLLAPSLLHHALLLAVDLHVLHLLLLVLRLTLQCQLCAALNGVVVHLLQALGCAVAAEDHLGDLEANAISPRRQLLVDRYVVQLLGGDLELLKGLACNEFNDVTGQGVDKVRHRIVRLPQHCFNVHEAIEDHDLDSHQGIVTSPHSLNVKVRLLWAATQLREASPVLVLPGTVRVVSATAVPAELVDPFGRVLWDVEARATDDVPGNLALPLSRAGRRVLLAVDD